MWQVRGGDPIEQQRFLDLLAQSHSYGTTLRSWYGGKLIGEVTIQEGSPVESGSVRVTGLNRERRGLTLNAAEALYPMNQGDMFSPYGNWLTVVGTIASGLLVYDEIPIFAGKVMRPSRTKNSGSMTVTAVDPMWQVNREPFEAIRRVPAGASIPDTIAGLIVEVFPAAVVYDRTNSETVLDEAAAWDAQEGSRGAAIDQLAAAIGAEVFALPTRAWPGGEFVIRPVPAFGNPIAWTLPTGAGAVIDNDDEEQTGENIVNRWMVLVERADQPPLYVPVTDDVPSSPTRYGGPIGHLTDFMSSPFIRDAGQAMIAGQARLARSVGAARSRRLRMVANPAMDAGDILGVPGEDGATEYHIADEFELPLTPDPPTMEAATRSTTGGNP